MRKLLMADPEFSPGSEHTAHALMMNNTPKAWTYDSELYLVKAGTKYASSGIITFSLAAGASRSIDFPISMPDIEGTYKVYLDVYVGGELIATYIATEDVVVSAVPPPLAFSYSNERADSLPKSNPNYHWLLFECDITNTSPVTATGIVTVWRQNHRGDIRDLHGVDACDGTYSRCPVCKDPGQIELTLAPGETYHYRFCSYNASYLYVSQYYLWVTDDMGGESAHANVGEAAPYVPPTTAWGYDFSGSGYIVSGEASQAVSDYSAGLIDKSLRDMVVALNKWNVRNGQLKGDFNDDGKIDFDDFTAFSACYGTVLGDAAYHPIGDFDDNGVIDIYDFYQFNAIYVPT